jgi:hypothetical protein
MANIKPDLNKLKSEIDNRKRERGIVAENVQGTALLPKDVFLNELMTSLQTGRETKATNLIKVVENKTAAKFGEVIRHDVNPIPQQHPVQPKNINEIGMSPERDELLFAEFERRKNKSTLAESIEGFNKTAPPAVQNYMNTPYVGQPMQPQVINEQYLTENVKKIATNFLVENLGPILEEAIKNTVLEMYAVDRIKGVLTENKEMIKTVVYETIRELQAKNKNKGQ